MPGQGREIRRRIKSIKSTRQITKAMELVSAAKMRKAVASVLATRPFATIAWEVVREIAGKMGSYPHPLLGNGREGKGQGKIALILITSNRGLAGSLNANIIHMAQEYIASQARQGVAADLVVMGKKGRDACARRSLSIIAEFTKADTHERVEGVRPLARLIMDEYLRGTYVRVMVAYTDFVSALVQKPRIRQILPILGEDPYLGRVEVGLRDSQHDFSQGQYGVKPRNQSHEAAYAMDDGYLFEPSPAAVLDALLPRVVEVQLYQAVLESDASEHSARMFAMRNATEAAGEMIGEFTLLYNQTRQAGITQEIAEISAGRIAVER